MIYNKLRLSGEPKMLWTGHNPRRNRNPGLMNHGPIAIAMPIPMPMPMPIPNNMDKNHN
jgi:hypothetical protein